MSSLLLAFVLQDAVVIERTADIKIWNTLGEERKIRAKQIVTIAGDSLRIEDATFGEVIVIHGDTIAKFDPFLKIAYEADVRKVVHAQTAELDLIRSAREQVRGTEDEKLLTQTLIRFGRYDGEPKVDVKPTGGAGEVAGEKFTEQVVNVELDRPMALATIKIGDAEGGNYYPILARAGAFHPKVAEAFAKLKGAPLAGRERYVLLGESYYVEFETQKIERRTVDAKIFDVPEGFAKAPKPDLKIEKKP